MRHPSVPVCSLILVLAATGFAKSWNNITPLETTRAEVIKLMGEPKRHDGKSPEYFEYDGQKIAFEWVRPNCYEVGPLKIDESSADADSLVYHITVNTENSNQDKYETVVRQFLTSVNKEDCVAVRSGGCGIFDFNIGFSYTRSERGITRFEYSASQTAMEKWWLSLKRCSGPQATE